MDKIRVHFILPENCTSENVSEMMLQAYEACKQNVVNVSWVEQSKFDSTDFSKTDFVIFEEFKGKHFDDLTRSKCARILGPWCVLVCLMEGRPIPNFTWPIYNVAMSGCVISCSHIVKAKKMEIKEKVQLMGGCYTESLMSTNTHLVTGSVKSEKYLHAAESSLKLMISKWIDAVWEVSQSTNIHCDDEQFRKYKCLPFHNLTISSTGLPNVDMRSQLAQNVAKNGGVFTTNLVVASTDVLVVHGESGIMSKKYKAVSSNPNIFCVSLDWINDSIEKGYALPHNLYTVTKKSTSTPTKPDEPCPNFSIISAIGDVTAKSATTIDESVAVKKSQPSFFINRISPNKRKCSMSEDVDKLVDCLDIKKAKKAGQYLDGYSVYLAGFKPEQREKLSKILNLSGATRYDDISDRLTHIIVGDSTSTEVKIIKSKNYSVSLVSIHWLLDSMSKQQALDEENYLINLHEFDKEQFSSPLGRKGLSLLRSNKTLTSIDIEAANSSTKSSTEIDCNDVLLKQYLKPATKDEDSDTLQLLQNNFNSKFDSTNNHTQAESEFTEDTNIFYSKNFLVVNFSPEESQNLKEVIENVLGKVMSKGYKGIPDYAVAPLFLKTPIQVSALETVNNLWIHECVEESDLIQIQYYHRPLVISDGKPLENCVVTISGYTSYERNFLRELIETLGGVSQDQFARVSCDEKNVSASTHLVSLQDNGKKYAAALKWSLPVVNKDWLFACAKSGKLEDEENFLVGDAKVPLRSDFRNVQSKLDAGSTPASTSKSGNLKDFRNAQSKSDIGTPASASKSRKVFTPLSEMQPLNVSKSEKTPVNQRLFEGVAETPCSQVTPINKLMAEIRRTNLLGTPQTPPMPKTWYDVDTPDSPFGAFIRPHLSPKSKKELMRYINRIPDFVPPPTVPKSTPLSEVKRRCWKKLLGQGDSPSSFPDNRTEASTSNGPNCDADCSSADAQSEDAQNAFINTKLKQIEEMVSAFGNTRRESKGFESTVPAEVGNLATKDSQPFTVGWDYQEESQPPKPQEQMRIFIISGVENEQRQSLVDKIESLGGHVSDLISYDPNCTHLICAKPARNEKTLACMASGKWILHMSYVDRSVTAGKFLNEEDFEFGNPKSKENIKIAFDKDSEVRVHSIHWWRKQISRRGYGAFNDMRAIVVAQKRDPIVRVIEAGGGQIVDVAPPFETDVHATHCLLEARSVSDFSVYNPLAQQGVLCISTLYISDFLHRINKDIKDAILPHFSKFYS